MNPKSIISRAEAIMFPPNNEWEVINTDNESNANIIPGYTLPFLILAANTLFY